MKWTTKRAVVACLAGVCGLSGISGVHAGSGAISVSITFDVAPAELLRTRAIAPAAVRSCLLLERTIAEIWGDAARRPGLECSSPEKAPLIVTSLTGGTLVVRP